MDDEFPKWNIHDETVKRSTFLRLTIRDADTNRIIATLPDVPLADEEKVAAIREEARIISLSAELAFMLEHFVYASETKGEPKYSDGKLYREVKKAAYNLIDRVKGFR